MTLPDTLTQKDAMFDPSSAAEANAGAGPPAGDIAIAFDKFRLNNGLTVIVHENRRAPVVAMNLVYRVGAKEEPAGKSGFAHLFEHLMFSGSANHPGHFIANLKQAGATGLNGTTNRDRTNYFATVPTVALDYALFAESDRMGHFYETISQETLDQQRGVVQNEKREREGVQYGRVNECITLGTYPVGHPYAHTVLGSMEDLSGATLDDVRTWFKTYYGPSNAILTLAGDIDLATAREKVTEYFGHIPSGPPLARPRQWIAKMTGTRREVLEERGGGTQLHMVWNVPQYGDAELTGLELTAAVLTSGMSARLRRRLVHHDRTASSVAAGISAGTVSSHFTITASLTSRGDINAVEQVIEEELARLIAEGPSVEEVQRARSRMHAGFVRQLDSMSGIAEMLAKGEMRLEKPEFFHTSLARLRQATPESVREAAARWLSDGLFSLHVVPFHGHRPSEQGIDRSRPPAIGEPQGLRLPTIQRETLANGMRIVLAERHDLPLVQFNMQFETGCIAEPQGRSGMAQFTAALMTSGAGARDALQFAEAKQEFGAELGVGADLEHTVATLLAMKGQLEDALGLYADMILRPQFNQPDIELQRSNTVKRIRSERSTGTLQRAQAALLLPARHPYARPLSGSGLKAHIVETTRDHIVEFHRSRFRPQLATLIVVGDTTMAEIKPMLERHFGDWERSETGSIEVPLVPQPTHPKVYLADTPGAVQSVICAATVIDPIDTPADLATHVADAVLAGDFASRVNMNLREDKHWTYGVHSRWLRLRGPQFYTVSAAVQIDKTCEAMVEMRREMLELLGPRPVTEGELQSWLQHRLLSLAGEGASLGGLSNLLTSLVRKNLPDDYWFTFADRLRAVTPDAVNEAVQRLADPAHMIWMIDGDGAQCEAGIRALDFGPFTRLPDYIDSLYPADL